MRDGREQISEGLFDCSESERAAFEAGIKLGTIYHQYVGVPISAETVETLEKAMESGSMVQPFVEKVRVRIDRSKLRTKVGEYDYVSLTGDMLDVSLEIKYKGTRVIAGMKFVKEMNYPLMYIERVVREG